MFCDFECTQNTVTHEVNSTIPQDFNCNEYIHDNIEEFCKNMINDKFNGYTFIANNSKGYNGHFN